MADLIENREILSSVRAKLNATINPYPTRAAFEAATIPAAVSLVYAIEAGDVYQLVRDATGTWTAGDSSKWAATIASGISYGLMVTAQEAAEAAAAQAASYGSRFTETDAEMASVVIDPDVTFIARVCDTAGQVAPEGQLSWWVRNPTPGTDPYFTTSGGVTWTETGLRSQDVLAAINSAIAALGTEGQQIYATRAAAVAALTAGVPATVARVGWYTSVLAASNVETIFVSKTSGATDWTVAGWLPDGDVTPDHWADNTTPGTTDMSAAIEAAANYGKTRLLAKTYQCNSPIEVYARNGASLVGDDREASVIRFGTGNDNWLTFYTRQTSGGVPLSCIGVKMRNLTLKTSDLGKTSGYLVYFEERGIGCTFEDIDIYGGFNQFRASALGVSFFTRCRFYTGGKTVAGGKMLHFYADETVGVWDPASPIQFAKSTDVHVTDCQFNPDGGELFEDAIAIDAADGIYFSNCHIRGATNCVAYEALAEPCRSVIASVSWSNCYFDAVNGSHVIYRGVGNGTLWTAPGVGGAESDIRYRDHKYTGCRFREAGNSGDGTASLGSFIADMTSGYVDWITVTGSTFRQNYRSGIYAPTTGEGFRFLNVSGSTFVENNEVDASSHGDIWVSGGGHNITGNTCIAGGANGNAIRVGGGTERGLISGNNVEQSTTTTKISRGGSSVSIRGNVGYTLRAKGQVTITNPATTAVVTHGLSAAPESGDIILTFRGNPSPATHAWVTAVGSTTFTINLNASPTASVLVDWQVNAERL